MNGVSTTFNPAKAIQDADQILSIANKVEGLFSEADSEIAKVQSAWQSDNSAQAAFKLYNSYKNKFTDFLSQIKNNSTNIKNAAATYSQADTNANKAIDSGFRIQG